MGSHRVGQDWSDLAAAAADFTLLLFFFFPLSLSTSLPFIFVYFSRTFYSSCIYYFLYDFLSFFFFYNISYMFISLILCNWWLLFRNRTQFSISQISEASLFFHLHCISVGPFPRLVVISFLHFPSLGLLSSLLLKKITSHNSCGFSFPEDKLWNQDMSECKLFVWELTPKSTCRGME